MLEIHSTLLRHPDTYSVEVIHNSSAPCIVIVHELRPQARVSTKLTRRSAVERALHATEGRRRFYPPSLRRKVNW